MQTDLQLIALEDLTPRDCEGSFLERSVGVAQLLLARPDNRRPAGPASVFGKRRLP